MRETVYSINELKSIVAPIAEQHGVERIYLFGSYARGDFHIDSDVDIMILADTSPEEISYFADKIYDIYPFL